MFRFILALLAFSISAHVAAEDQAIACIFDRHGVHGAIVVSSLRGGETFIHNEARANKRFTAASTFKILNTLIALEEKAVSGKDDVFKWNGHVYSIPNWNRDQTLESAFKVSCVWCYQELARKVGAEKYRHYLRKTGYGRLVEPFKTTSFWLDGSLKLSAVEQIEILKKIHKRSLPFSATSYDTLLQVMLVEQTPDFSLRAKTGLAGDGKPQVGWYVGYVETAADVWFFALNMEVHGDKDIPLRLTLAREVLRAKGVLD
jgi:beta-lactamase class D